MNDEEKKAVFYLKDLENDKEHLIIEQRQAITTILNLIEKQDKIINEMAKVMIDSSICDYFIKQKCKHYAGENKKTCDNCIIEYFEKKVGETNDR